MKPDRNCKNANRKKRALLGFAFFMTVVSCKRNGDNYLYLNAEQLKPLGIELSENGLFYKNYNPNWEKDGKRSCYWFYSTGEGCWIGSQIGGFCLNDYPEGYELNAFDSLFLNMKTTENDFYPLFAGNTEGKYNFSSEKQEKALLPIAICMAETKIPNRTDTLLFWFKVTDNLKKALPKGTVIEKYLGLPVVKNE